MVRIAKITDPKKINELKMKIHDSLYINDAIGKIASVLSEEIFQQQEEKKEYARN